MNSQFDEKLIEETTQRFIRTLTNYVPDLRSEPHPPFIDVCKMDMPTGLITRRGNRWAVVTTTGTYKDEQEAFRKLIEFAGAGVLAIYQVIPCNLPEGTVKVRFAKLGAEIYDYSH